MIGGKFIGHIEQVVHGQPLTETYTGTLGPSVRAVVPVVDAGPVGGLGGVGLPEALGAALALGEERNDEIHLTGEHVLVINQARARWDGVELTVVTLRDHTDLQALTGELDSVCGFAGSLGSQAHEATSPLHT